MAMSLESAGRCSSLPASIFVLNIVAAWPLADEAVSQQLLDLVQ
jgi:hypothetical protein